MARSEKEHDLFYRPAIDKPERISRLVDAPKNIIQDRARSADIPDPDIPDPFLALKSQFADYEQKARELKDRALFMLNKTIDDIDGYFGDDPPVLQRYIEDLTGIRLTDNDVPLSKTDPAYTLTPDMMRCIFRVAGYSDPSQQDRMVAEAVAENWDAQALQDYVDASLSPNYFQSIVYGAKLLITTLKMSYIIMVHYTVGYFCGFFKGKMKIGKKWEVKGVSFGFEYVLGDMIAGLFGNIQKVLLSVIGFRCDEENETPANCDAADGDIAALKRMPCCTMKPVFFSENEYGQKVFNMSKCFERWVRGDIDPPERAGRAICSMANANDTSIAPTEEEKAKAKVVTDALMSKPTRYGVMNPADITPLSSAIAAADTGVMIASQAQSALDSGRNYAYQGRQTAPWDCFGYTPEDDNRQRILQYQQSAMGTGDLPILEQGNYLFEYLKAADSALASILQMVDRVVSCTANLAKWGSSRQLCCFIYLMVLIATLVYRMITTGGKFCEEQFVECPHCEGQGCQVCGGTGRVSESQAFADSIRNEFRWAANMRDTEAMKTIVELLTLIKQIIDIFRRKMSRTVFLAGLKLPLGEMWAMVKMTIANGLSEFLDILFGPLDMVLAGIKGVPEVRHMMNNECFGFDKFFNFLSCLLGNLKFGLIGEIMDLFDNIELKDKVIINDIYLSRTRLAFLDSLSKLLGNMINLLVGLRDCYDPQILIDALLQQQQTSQYNDITSFANLAGDAATIQRIDECSRPLTDQNPFFSQEEAAHIDAMPGSISSALGGLGYDPLTIMSQELQADIAMTSFIEEHDEGWIVRDIGEMTRIMEDATGITMAQTRESLQVLVSILEGSNANT